MSFQRERGPRSDLMERRENGRSRGRGGGRGRGRGNSFSFANRGRPFDRSGSQNNGERRPFNNMRAPRGGFTKFSIDQRTSPFRGFSSIRRGNRPMQGGFIDTSRRGYDDNRGRGYSRGRSRGRGRGLGRGRGRGRGRGFSFSISRGGFSHEREQGRGRGDRGSRGRGRGSGIDREMRGLSFRGGRDYISSRENYEQRNRFRNENSFRGSFQNPRGRSIFQNNNQNERRPRGDRNFTFRSEESGQFQHERQRRSPEF